MLWRMVSWRIRRPCVRDADIAASLAQNKVSVLNHRNLGGHVTIVIAVRNHHMRRVTPKETSDFIVYVLDKVIAAFLTGRKVNKSPPALFLFGSRKLNPHV